MSPSSHLELAVYIFGGMFAVIHGLTLFVVSDIRARVMRLENKAMKG